jgi:inhibitor of KinA
MLGFLPGFAYMGEVDEKIVMPRKPQPQNVLAGSVGIAGKQTGIYPLASPGGWQIIGRTPLKLFDAEREEPVLLKAGDTVQFYSISKDEFESF